MPPALRPERKTDRLHRGRISAAGARYFVTFVTAGRKPWLAAPGAAETTLAALRVWHEERDGAILAATVMPDHVHALFELGNKLTVGQCAGRWKSAARRAVRFTENWQRDFWEHRLRDDEGIEDYGLYVFLNPYRAGLARRGEAWKYFWASEPAKFLFSAMLEPTGAPPREWIEWPDDRFAGLGVGE